MTLTHVRPAASPAGSQRRIGEVARLLGVSPSALRLWERQGLVSPERSGGRYRLYSEDDLRRLRHVRRLRHEDQMNAAGIRRVIGGRTSAGDEGTRLRELRRQRGLSLREAAALTGTSMSLISAVERGAASASVVTMQRLTSLYGATVADLFAAGGGSEARVVRAGKGPMIELGHAAVRIEHLRADSGMLEPQLFVIGAGASSEGSYAHDGEEFLFVLSGALTVWVGDDERYRLREGDALSFPSTLPHRWRNHADRETRLLWINTPPTF